MNTLERTIAVEAYNDQMYVTLFRSYRNFQTWYTLEVFRMGPDNSLSGSYTTAHDYYDVDRVFDLFDWYVDKKNLKVIDKEAV